MSAQNKKQIPTIAAHFGELDDPRRTYLNTHPLINIMRYYQKLWIGK